MNGRVSQTGTIEQINLSPRSPVLVTCAFKTSLSTNSFTCCLLTGVIEHLASCVHHTLRSLSMSIGEHNPAYVSKGPPSSLQPRYYHRLTIFTQVLELRSRLLYKRSSKENIAKQLRKFSICVQKDLNKTVLLS